jgi:transcription elongation factor GreA
MTIAATPSLAHDVLSARLADLRSERESALSEIVPPNYGDDADRATNVDAHVRLAMLDERIADIEYQLTTDMRPAAHPAGIVDLGALVTVDLGDGAETYLYGTVDQASAQFDVITPGSPLGRALLGLSAGTSVTYEARPHRKQNVLVMAVE